MRIAYLGIPDTIHDDKWINFFAEDPSNNILLIYNKEYSTRQINSNVKLYPILKTYSYFNFIKRWMTLFKISKILKKNNIQIVHSLYGVSYCFWPFHLKQKNHVITTRGSDILEDYTTNFRQPDSFLKKISYPKIIKLIESSFNDAKIIISTSGKQQRIIRSFLKDHSKMHLVRTGTDITEKIKEIKNTKRENTEDFIVFSNRFSYPLYNIDLIVEAVSYAKAAIPNIKLKLIHSQPESLYTKKILALIKKLGLTDTVILLPEQPVESMVYHNRNSDVVVMIPNSDGTPVSAIEAMLVGTPVILGNFDYDTDLFNENTVWKLKKTSSRDLANMLCELYLMDKMIVNKKLSQAYLSACTYGDRKKEMLKVKEIYKSVLS